jgi:hypothetical protein
MKLHSPYLNPFRAFLERRTEDTDEQISAIENNMSRAVMSALAQSERIESLASFLQQLAKHTPSKILRERVDTLANSLQGIDPNTVEVGLQSWPGDERRGLSATDVLLIGIRSSFVEKWTAQRPAPSAPKPDAWIYARGKLLVVFEFKNDDFPLDAVQIASYGHALEIFPATVDVPRPQPGHVLSPDEASAVHEACIDIVLDAPWSAVVSGLETVQQWERAGTVGHWLCGQALEYLKSHIHPPYEGPKTILDWLSRGDTPDHRRHLRILVRKMGEELERSASGPGAITFAKDKSGEPDILTGTISSVYVRLQQDRRPIEHQWLGKTARLNLWFDSQYGAAQRVGMDFWVEAEGAQQNLKVAARPKLAVESWNRASGRQERYAEQFERRFEEWCESGAGGRVDVYAVRFKGKNQIWKGGGDYSGDAPKLRLATPREALGFLRRHRAALWRFPRVGPEGECETIDQAQPLVRKPGVALWVPLNVRSLEECGPDANRLQVLLKDAVDQIAKIASSQ